MRRATLEAAASVRTTKQPLAILTPLRGGGETVWRAGEGGLPPELVEAAARALATDDAFVVETGEGPFFVQPVQPPLRLVIVGAVHIAEPLVTIAVAAGYEVQVVDPRRAFARAERWPAGVAVSTDWPDEALARIGLDGRCAVVALTHDPKIDDPALDAALRSPAFYVGALGSKKTHAARLRRLAAQGFGARDLERISGPIGLPIGARSPGEIAVAIVAEMIGVSRRGAAACDRAAQRTVPPPGLSP